MLWPKTCISRTPLSIWGKKVFNPNIGGVSSLDGLHSSEVTVTIGADAGSGSDSVMGRRAVLASGMAILLGMRVVSQAKNTPRKVTAQKEHASDRLRCVIETADPETFETVYKAFLQSDPADISTLPQGPLELGIGVYVAIAEDVPGDASVKHFRKVLLTFPAEDISDPIECDNKGFVMLADDTAGFQVRTSAVEVVEGGVKSTAKAGYLFPAGTTTSWEQLRWMCGKMSSYTPKIEKGGGKAKVAWHENADRKSAVWFEPRPLPEKQILAAEVPGEEKMEESMKEE